MAAIIEEEKFVYVYKMLDEDTQDQYLLVFDPDSIPSSVEGTSPNGANNTVKVLDMGKRRLQNHLLLLDVNGNPCVGKIGTGGALQFNPC